MSCRFLCWQGSDVNLTHTSYPQCVMKHTELHSLAASGSMKCIKSNSTVGQGSLGSSRPEVSAQTQTVLKPFSKWFRQLDARDSFHGVLLREGLHSTQRYFCMCWESVRGKHNIFIQFNFLKYKPYSCFLEIKNNVQFQISFQNLSKYNMEFPTAGKC